MLNFAQLTQSTMQKNLDSRSKSGYLKVDSEAQSTTQKKSRSKSKRLNLFGKERKTVL